jgi:hypothetical protein
MLRSTCISLLLLSTAIPFSANAEWTFSGGLGVRHVRMTELDMSGQVLVTERGWLPGVRLRAENGMENWRFGISGDVHGNDISYDGRTQNGVPFKTDTDTLQSRVGIDVSRSITATTLLVAGLEWDFWKRRIKGHSGVLGMDERYTSWRLLGGTEFNLLWGSAGLLRARTMLVASGPERMRVVFDTGIFDDVRLSTKAAAGTRIGLAFVPVDIPAMTIDFEFDWLRVPRSAGAVVRRGGNAVGTVTQPEHVRRSLEIGVSYRF